MRNILIALMLMTTMVSCALEDHAPPTMMSKAEPASAPNGDEVMEPAPGKPKLESEIPQERMIIRTATLALEAENTDATTQKVKGVVEASKGYIVETNANGGEGWSSVSVTARVPATAFDATLEALRALGTVTSEQIQGQDVTEEFVDLSARLKVQRALEERMLQLLQTAASVEDTIQVERELARIREVIERMEGRTKFLKDQTSMSTITVNVASKNTPASDSEIMRAFGDAGEIIETVIAGMIRVIAALSPIAAVGGLALFGLMSILRRRKKKA